MMSLRLTFCALLIWIGGEVNHASALTNCNSTITLHSSQSLNENYEKTTSSSTPCIQMLGGYAQTVNLAGHTITCNSSTGCGTGPAIDVGVGKAKNGNIVAGSGDWEVGITCVDPHANGCTLSNLYIEASETGIEGGKKISDAVILGAERCIDSIGDQVNTGFYKQIYCSATDEGFRFKGTDSGTFTVERNFIRVPNGTGIEVQDGDATLKQNIVDASTPVDDTNAGTVTFEENICSDASDCPDPIERGFSLSVNFN